MLAAFVIFLSAVVYRIQTDKGELIITTDEVSDSGKAARGRDHGASAGGPSAIESIHDCGISTAAAGTRPQFLPTR